MYFFFFFFFPVSSDGVSFPDKDPKSLARSSDGLILVASLTDLFLVRGGTIVNSIPAQGEPLSALFNPTRAEVAVGAKVSLLTVIVNIMAGKLSLFGCHTHTRGVSQNEQFF